MTTRYNWSNAPKWAEWAARDENDCAYWYERLPIKGESSFDIEYMTHDSYRMNSIDILDKSEYWGKSLERRVK